MMIANDDEDDRPSNFIGGNGQSAGGRGILECMHQVLKELAIEDAIKSLLKKDLATQFSGSNNVRRSDVLSAWVVFDRWLWIHLQRTQRIYLQDHVVHEDHPGLVTITGGKWTTYRSMAEDTVDVAIKSAS
ncbi:hypothetical protein HPP92_008470 [Vanilla planifolia]|uniref:glycerol-3-phosphate dehydrogenase n=1 Tax=Vanilla planifolia TaxID=51239 RepID=A0A835V619_VANPL|nr:hypothetical protein HPP92_008470 [Vanilla planifolia]